MDARLVHPFTMTVAGPTGCGKTVFVSDLLKEGDKLIDCRYDRILWCYGIWQPLYSELMATEGLTDRLTFHEGIPVKIADADYFDTSQRNCIVLDDLMTAAGKDPRILLLFTVGSHHRNLSVVHLTQNLFDQSKHARGMSLNSHYLVVFRNPRDKSTVSHLARQCFPENGKFLVEAYKDATSRPWGYLLLDFKADTDDQYRVRANINPKGDSTQHCYVMQTAAK